METYSVKISPFSLRNVSLNLKVSNRDKFDNYKQVNALMPNFIHSLDGASLALLYDKFIKTPNDNLFYSIHDCFAVTAPNIEKIKVMLASVYVELYSQPTYLKEFDEYLMKTLQLCSDCRVDLEARSVIIPDAKNKNPYRLCRWY